MYLACDLLTDAMGRASVGSGFVAGLPGEQGMSGPVDVAARRTSVQNWAALLVGVVQQKLSARDSRNEVGEPVAAMFPLVGN